MSEAHEIAINPAVRTFIDHVAKVSHAVGQQAGVGGMETAGAILSYLAKHPDQIEPFMTEGFFGLPLRFHEQGCLTWHAMNGRVVAPAHARRAHTIRGLARPAPGADQSAPGDDA